MEDAYDLMYNRLAEFMIRNLHLYNNMTILEVGCGKGQLSVPLFQKIEECIKKFNLILLDLSIGPYKGVLNILKENLSKKGINKKVNVLEGDARNLDNVKTESVDLIISNELFCDLGRKGLKIALNEFYRVLKPSGQMCHGELVPTPANKSQELFIKADSFSTDILTDEYEWFSPFADEAVIEMHNIGFTNLIVKYFEPKIHLPFNEAIQTLKKWKVNTSFININLKELKQYGIEFPIEHIIFSKKP